MKEPALDRMFTAINSRRSMSFVERHLLQSSIPYISRKEEQCDDTLAYRSLPTNIKLVWIRTCVWSLHEQCKSRACCRSVEIFMQEGTCGVAWREVRYFVHQSKDVPSHRSLCTSRGRQCKLHDQLFSLGNAGSVQLK